ncbi:hypothetical protein LJ737_07250 [Hymenobacter sp. 15J16-1T3B]|uniref:hypothetical protein n=1 Tax=Hymenobacter sp. 15J16-1T3B TaxID=2886941 RepID=UPI001D1140D8|nr:hypothetical protein [Hymenobacter sp. 15J16-1T3B]MCC3157028.1 hypothetical protein [Hymenobacter sp. 15J16-1T3B]
MEAATPTSWKTQPLPAQRERVEYARQFSAAELIQLPLTPAADGEATSAAFWVSRDPAEYPSTDAAADQQTLTFLIDRLLLGRPVTFPAPAAMPSEQAAVLRHHVVGHGRSNQP